MCCCILFFPNYIFQLKLQADVLVSSVGASCQAIVNAGVPAMTNPNVGGITVNSGLPLTNHVIHTNCCQWQGGTGEAVSIVVILSTKLLSLSKKITKTPQLQYGKRNKAKGGNYEHWLA